MTAKDVVKTILKNAGININGHNAWDIQVHDERFYGRVLSGGSLALGESYMDGWWDVKALDEFFYRVVRSGLEKRRIGVKSLILPYIRAKLFNTQRSNAYHIGQWHYDIGNELYEAMLDSNMQYSCGYWKDAKNLEEAQKAKLDLICKKLKLKKGETLLDIGCGWGTLLKYAAKKYGVKGVGITVSEKQAKLAREKCKGLPVEILVQDYRLMHRKFDKIVSVGMIEHVGFKNYSTFMKTVHQCLNDDGIFLLHTIGSYNSSTGAGDPWVDRYIFPDGKLPSIAQLSRASEGLFMTEDLQCFGSYYSDTLRAWHANFVKAWPKLKSQYDDRFYRMWTYYLLMFTGTFRARLNQLWQIVYTKVGNEVTYERVV
ncbi:MAG: cyclopropane fatty acyl phospholipid synthase [Candidatus Woesearchaeota archaeon]